ncbi:MAG: HAD hydrolase family protein [Nanoarchaeota archaeon]|nr:HAD hydrolase family protein [Nanoarchaeota archaeon]
MDFKKIMLVVCDFDGVMTDNKVIMDENGKESVVCNRGDGLGIDRLKENDIEVICLSKERNKVVEARCRKVKIGCCQGIDDKPELFKKEVSKRGLTMDQVCFIGNDVNDIGCLKEAGIGVATNDAYPDVKKVADFITKTNGGEGVVREVSDLILKG